MRTFLINFLLILLSSIGIVILFNSYFKPTTSCPLCKQEGNQLFYSQYYEDYLLSIIFAKEKIGFYVDIGASDPKNDSTTQYFYANGWSGINIEPISSLFVKLKKERPRDINLNVGVSDKTETLTFYQLKSNRSSTFNMHIVDIAQKKGFSVNTSKIAMMSLNEILNQFHSSPINFIKIDVEGFESKVLRGVDLEKFRPDVFVIEALEPFTLKPNYHDWEPILLSHHYLFVLSDGLNRYYLAEEKKSQLLPHFRFAANCLIEKSKVYPSFRRMEFNQYLSS